MLRKLRDKASLYGLRALYGRKADISCAYFGPDERPIAEAPLTGRVGIVLQGLVTDSDRLVAGLEQYRRLLPEAILVVSTWKGQQLDGVAEAAARLGVILLETDPPSIGGILNVNKQIVSTARGIEAIIAAGDVAMIAKARTDYFPWRPDRAFRTMLSLESLLGGQPRIWGVDINTRLDLPFSFADIFQVGRTDAMRRYWNEEPLYPTNMSAKEFLAATDNQRDRAAVMALRPGEIFVATRYMEAIGCRYDHTEIRDYLQALAKWFGILDARHIELSFNKYSNFCPGLEPPEDRNKRYISLPGWLENLESAR